MQHDQLVFLTDLVDSLRREGVEGLLAEVGGDPAEAAIHLASMAAAILSPEQGGRRKFFRVALWGCFSQC